MKTILLIEDNNDIRENTIEILELNGYNVIAASNGIIGIDLAKNRLPDLILCDIMMPDADGYEVLTQIKKEEATMTIPFVFVTASVEKKAIDKGIEMGANGYLRKPFDTEELFETILRFL